jgi:predicted acyltransferase
MQGELPMELKRDHSLDAFRGLTVLLMIIVNIQGSGDAAFAALKHAEWNGLTFADLVFPWFLFIVGLSIPLALDRAHSRSPWPLVIRRTLILFALGVILSWLIRPVEFDMIRWLGVLQRIAIVYFACAAVILLRPGWKIAALLAVLILIVHSWLILFIPAPGQAVPGLGPGEGLSGWFDQQFLPGRLLRKSYDPEGILSTFPAIASGLAGVSVMRWMRSGAQPADARLFLAGTVVAFAGLAASVSVPVNKELWTASFVLITAGLGLILWITLRYVWPRVGENRVARWFVLLGQTALTLYVIHMLLLALIVRKLPNGQRIWDMLYAKLAATGLSTPIASLVFALLAGAICVAPLGWLKRRGWLIKA